MDVKSIIAQNLRKICDEKGVTFTKLSEESGVHYATISRIANGRHTPTFATIGRLASALGETPESLWFKITKDIPEPETFGDYLRQICLRKGISQAKLSEMSGVCNSVISKAINNICVPSEETIVKLANTLCIDPTDLFP